MLYGLKHRPKREADYSEEEKVAREVFLEESGGAGNSSNDIRADWVDMASIGVEKETELNVKAVHYLSKVGLESDVYQIGLRQTIDKTNQEDLANKILGARQELRKRLDGAKIAGYVESFDREKFNGNASVAENILFGTPVGENFNIESLGENEYVQEVLNNCGLTESFMQKGQKLAEIMVDLFRGLPADHEFFERFSFISSDDLPEFESLLTKISNKGLDSLADEDRSRLRVLPFKLIPARHHVGLVDDDFCSQLLKARIAFSEGLPDDLQDSVEFFDSESYNSASSVQDNILFGKLASERAGSSDAVGELMIDVIRESDLHSEIIDLGLNYDVGNGGSRLSNIQRQKLALARGMFKEPDIFVMNEALTGLDQESQQNVLKSIRKEQEGKSLLFVPSETEAGEGFDKIFSVKGGKVLSEGDITEQTDSSNDGSETKSEGGFGDEIDVLAGVPLFGGLDRSKLKLLSFASERHKYAADENVFKQGDVGDKAYVIISGDADVILETDDGPKKLVTMAKNDLFGELALLCDAPRTATIKASSELSLMSISKDVFFKLISEDINMSARVTRFLADRLVRTTKDLSEAKK